MASSQLPNCKKKSAAHKNGFEVLVSDGAVSVSAADLLLIPPGGVTRAGLELNIRVATLFIHSWLAEGRGCFALDGRAEDSATAEISRSQVQSIIYLARLNNFQ